MTMTPLETWVYDSTLTSLLRRGRNNIHLADGFVDYQTIPTKTNTGAFNISDPTRQQIIGSSPLSLTTPNVTYQNVDFYVPVVRVKAANIRFINCYFHGEQWASGPATSANTTTVWDTLLDCRDSACVGCYVERCTFSPDYPNWLYTGIIGHDYVAYRSQFTRSVDGFGVYRTQQYNVDTNVQILCNYIDELAWFTGEQGVVHPSDTKTHNDGIQIQGGNRTKVWGNYIGGFLSTDPTVGTQDFYGTGRTYNNSNACIQMNSGGVGYTFATDIQYNFMDGAGEMLNAGGVDSTAAAGVPEDIRNFFGIISHNRIGRKALYPGQELTLSNTVTFTATDNTYMDNGADCAVRTNG